MASPTTLIRAVATERRYFQYRHFYLSSQLFHLKRHLAVCAAWLQLSGWWLVVSKNEIKIVQNSKHMTE